jgi:ADP-heptose:LPS heptosyltransferase
MSPKKTAKTLLAHSFKFSERILRNRAGWPAPENIRTVLILEYLLPLGCCVHLTPVYEAIKASRPDITIVVATRGLGAAVLRHNSAIDHVIETADPLKETFAAARSLRSALRKRGLTPDCILTSASDQRTRIALLSFLTEGVRGGFTLAPQLYDRSLQYERNQSLIANNLQLTSLLGIEPRHFEPRVYFSANNIEKARELASIANPEEKPLAIFITQNSGGQRTGWHTERFARVIRHVQTAGCAIAYVGTAADADAIQRIHQESGDIGTSLAGQTSISELAALLALSDIVVSLDTGTMHVGRAVGVPMVVIGPSWQRPIEWLPLGLPQVRILRGQDRDDIPQNYQLDEVKAEDVIDTFNELLSTYRPDLAARADRLKAGLSSVDHRSGQY